MEKLDLKDRKILYYLDINSRQSFASIGKKVGLHKDSVADRVKKFQDKGIIINFFTKVYGSTLYKGTSFRCYFSFQNITPDIKKEIINYLVESKYTITVRSLEGNYDILFFIMTESNSKAYSFWDKLMENYREYFSKKEFHGIYHESTYDYLFLLDEKDYKKENRKAMYQWYYDEKIEKLNDLDYKIIRLISQNSRLPAIEIAKKLNSTAVTITNRIEKLRKLEIIKGFQVNINWPKIGYYIYKVDIELKKSKELNKIIKYVEENPNLVWYFKSIGYVDLEFGFILNNVYQLHKIMEDLSIKFPDTIKNYTYFSVTKTHKVFKY